MIHKIKIIQNHLSTRQNAREILKIAKLKGYKVEINFEKVKTMSRSFIHELFLLKEKSNKDLRFININPNLARYMDYVKTASEEDYFNDIDSWKIEEV